MLSRVALARRSLHSNRFSASCTNVSSVITSRYAHARSRKPDKRPTGPPVLQASYLGRADPDKGPIQNRTWAPASSSPIITGGSKKKVTNNPQRPQPPEAPRIRANGQQHQQKSSFSTSTLKLSPTPNDTKSSSEPPEASEASKNADDVPQQPLPDLRHGIPSTFDQEVSGRSTSSGEQDASRTSLNLSESAPAAEEEEEQEQRRARGEGSREAYRSSIDRRREKVAFYGFLTGSAMILATVLMLGQNWDEREARGHPDIPNGWTPGAVYGRTRARLSEMLGYYTEPAFPQLLPHVDAAYKQPYTLVLSLEDLLVSSKWSRQNGWEVAKRPGLDYFIRYLSQYYELVLFTSVPSMSAQPVHAKLDPYHFIMFPLFREGTRYMNGEHVKVRHYVYIDILR